MQRTLRNLLLTCSIPLLLSAPAAAATREYLAQAADVPQIDSITVGGTWVATETASVQIGNATLTITTGSDTLTTAQVASVIANAINAPSIDASKIGKELRNAAGQLLGEFRDVEAVIHPDNTSVVLVRSKVAGQPFGTPAGGNMTVSETSTSGTAVRASVQAATGRWHWNNTTNWTGGVAPTTGDDVVFSLGTAGPKYGLPAGTWQPASVTIDATVGTGYAIGLADWNVANGLGYREYRQVDVQFNNDHTAATLYTIGRGTGAGARLMRFTHTGTAVDQLKGIVYTTDTPSGTSHALYFRSGATNEGTLKILKGSVALAAGKGETLGLGTSSTKGLEIGYVSTVATDASVLVGQGCDLNDTTVVVSGGTVELRADVKDVGASALLKIIGNGTLVKVAGDGTAASPVLSHVTINKSATLSILSEATIDEQLTIEGALDLRKGNGPITVGGTATLELRSSGTIDDPATRMPLGSFSDVMGGGAGGA
jgi:hypothetical protein